MILQGGNKVRKGVRSAGVADNGGNRAKPSGLQAAPESKKAVLADESPALTFCAYCAIVAATLIHSVVSQGSKFQFAGSFSGIGPPKRSKVICRSNYFSQEFISLTLVT